MPLSTADNQEVLRRSRAFGRPQREIESILPRRRGPGGVRLVLSPPVVKNGGLSLVYPPGGGVIPAGEDGWPEGQPIGLEYPPAGGGGGVVSGLPGVGVETGVSLSTLEILPVGLYFFVLSNDVNGAEFGPIPGPFLVRWVQIGCTTSYTTNDSERHWRVDFAPVAGRDAFVFVTSNPPSGASSAPYTLFRYNANFSGGGDGSDVARAGWLSLTPTLQEEWVTLGDLAVKIPLDSCFIKGYVSHDGASTEGFQMRLGISPLGNRLERSGSLVVEGAPTI